MATYIATCNQNFNDLGFQFHVPINGTRTVYYSTNGQNYTTSGNLPSANVTWTGYDVSDDGLFVYVAADRTSAASISPLTTYSVNQAAMLPAGTAWKNCVYGNGSFVSVCTSTTSGAYMRHKEGIGWTASTLPSTAAWSLLAFGNNTFVTVAPSSTSAARSVDNGLTWSAVTLPASLVWVDLKFYNGTFVLIANGSRNVYTSTDGSTWSVQLNALPTASTWKQVAWISTGGANGTWTVVPSTGATSAYSLDNGVTWTAATLPGSGNWIVTGGKAAFDGIEMFAALTISSVVGAYSYDGINWSLLTIGNSVYNEKLTIIKPRIMSGDTVTVNNGATLTVNTNQNVFLAGATALLINNGKVVVENNSTTTPIRFGTGRTSVAAALSSIDCVNGLGSFEANGNFIEIGTSNGTAGQTFTSPYTTGDYIPVVFVETAVGSGAYEPWTNVSGAPEQNQYNYFRNGLRGIGKETPSFVQDFDATAMQYKFLANTNAIANTNVITCTSTAGLLPGTWVYSRSLPSGVVVVQDILDGTRFTVNTIITYTLSSSTAGFANIPMVAILPVNAQNTSTLRFGDDINGRIIPTGCKVRVPNIMLTDYSPANFMNLLFTGANAPFCMRTSAGGGSFVLNKVLLGESYSNLSQASKVTMTDVGASYTPYISECYQATITNVGFALPPVSQVVGLPTALGATGACTATSATVTIPASSAIIPGVLLTGTGIHAATVTTVNSATSLTISTVAHTTSASVAYSYYGVWASREHRMLTNTAPAFGTTFTSAPWTFVSNINIDGLVMTFGGHLINGLNVNPSIATTQAGLLNFQYSNDVTVNNFTGINVGSYPKTRPYNTAFTPSLAGANHKYTNIKLYNVNGVLGVENVTNVEVDNVSHRSGINNEGYNWVSACRVFSDVKNNQFIPKDTKYWFKTRSYKTNDFHDTTGYVDSMPMCSAHGNFDKHLQMPQRFGVLPVWSTVTAPTLAYGNGKWIFLDGGIASNAQAAMVSADNGATWTAYMLPSTNATASVYWRDVIFSPTQNIFMAIGGGGAASTLIAQSTDGTSWGSVTTAPASAQWQKLAFDNTGTNKWVGVAGGSAVSTAGTYATITNGSVVFAASVLASAQWIGVTSNGAGRFVSIAGGSAVGTATSYSINGNTWTAGGAQVSSLWQSIAYGSAKYVAISASAVNGPTSYSTDGVAWTAGTATALPTGMTYSKILWTGTVFVALAGPAWSVTSHSAPPAAQFSSAFCTSADGITWSALKYLPEHTSWVGMANNGNAVGVISTQTGRFAYTADISIATPTWTLTSDVMAVWNRVSVFHQSTEFTTALNTAASVATTAGSTTMTCATTAGMQVGTIMTLANGTLGCGAIYLADGSGSTASNAVVVVSITNATTFVVNKPALRTATGLTGTFYKQVYQIFRSTTEGFTARDHTTFIGSTVAIPAGQRLYDDRHEVIKDTTYYYRVRKLSGGGAASVVNCSGTAAASTITTVASMLPMG